MQQTADACMWPLERLLHKLWKINLKLLSMLYRTTDLQNWISVDKKKALFSYSCAQNLYPVFANS